MLDESQALSERANRLSNAVGCAGVIGWLLIGISTFPEIGGRQAAVEWIFGAGVGSVGMFFGLRATVRGLARLLG